MSDEYRNKVVCCVDLGLFTEFAVALTKSFGTVLYCVPSVSAFPKSNDLLVGSGLPGVHRIDSIWEVLDEVDLWVFPDCNTLKVWESACGVAGCARSSSSTAPKPKSTCRS